MAELKPCPFCGSTNISCADAGHETDIWFVQCENCGATFPHFDSETEATEAWNGRVENVEYNVIKSAPTADVVEVRHGKWIETQEPLGWCDVDCAECSVCHESWIIDEDSSIDDYECIWHYCPNCGAKMDGDIE